MSFDFYDHFAIKEFVARDVTRNIYLTFAAVP